MLMLASGQSASLAIGGERLSGQAVRDQNTMAVLAVSNILKSSLGPVGLDKMLVDSIGDVTISNDGATILRLLEVEHPAARILVELAQRQDEEVGDGTTSVVIIAGELLKRANELVKQRIHPTTVISGLRLACREACRFIIEQMSVKVDTLGRDCLINCARTTLASKILSAHGDYFASMAVEALTAVRTTNALGEQRYPVKAVNILKAQGRSQLDSVLVRGYALNCTIASQAMPKHLRGGIKIACLDMNLQKARMHMGVTIQVEDPEKVEAIRQRESDIIMERIRRILTAGANVVLTSKGIDDLCLKPFVEAGAMAVRRVARDDLVRIAKVTGATLVSSLANLEGEESFESSLLGTAEEIIQERYGDHECILIKGAKLPSASVILRGANELMLDEMERSLHDALCAVKRALESGTVVPGGGAVETALSIYLETFATSIASREQMAVAEFGDALLAIPKVLALNAGCDSMELVSRLRSLHFAAQTASTDDVRARDLKWTGLDLRTGRARDSIAAGVLEPTISKVRALKSATEAAISILRIDDMMTIAPERARQGAEEDECQ